jgi:phosphatidylglycerophosphate synthase
VRGPSLGHNRALAASDRGIDGSRSASSPQWLGVYAGALRRLGAAQKSNKGAPAYSRFVNRPLGKRLAALAYVLNRTPNQVTCVSAVFTFSGIALLALAPPSLATGILTTGLLLFGYALDAADGQLARLRGGGSLAGEWLDHFTDSAKECSLHLAVLISMFRFWDLPNSTWLLLPTLFALVMTMMFSGILLKDLLARQAKSARLAPGTSASWLRAILVMPTDYGVICLVFLLWSVPTLFLGAYAALFVGNAIFLLLASRKWFNDMRSLDQASADKAV